MMLAKVCIMGEMSVGKTSLTRRFVDRSFDDTYLTTVGVSISRKLVPPPDSAEEHRDGIQLVLWDLEGGESFSAVASAYLKGARGAILVGDVTRPQTIEALERHAQRYLQINPRGIILLALNKSDLEHDQGILVPAALRTMEAVLTTFHTSARIGDGVDEAFVALAHHFLTDKGNVTVP
jgi:small GTP-binding protein